MVGSDGRGLARGDNSGPRLDTPWRVPTATRIPVNQLPGPFGPGRRKRIDKRALARNFLMFSVIG